MAPKQKQPRASQNPKPKSFIEGVSLPLGLLTLAAASSPISQATLAPVFGAIPSAVNHQKAVIATCLLGILLRPVLPKPRRGLVAQYLAVWAFWIPVIQMYLFKFSGALGPVAGPALIGFLSCHTIIIAATYAASEALEDIREARFSGLYSGTVRSAAVCLHLVAFERQLQSIWPALSLLSSVFTPVKMQLLTASTLVYLAPSRLTLLALPALIHGFFANPHFDSANTLSVLNGTLLAHNWTMLDRQWSSTGYISVLESLDMQYRVMRCDHSLLGGEWLLTEQRRQQEGWKVDEPIYSVFEMLEAVRLVEVEPPIVDTEAQALVVGLGVGTLPKAFVAHGINTTILELDPAVHDYATKYFGLPANHTAVIRDAVSWVGETASEGKDKYDYVVHDVFTGGAEPLALFTVTFLRNLRALLKPHGVVALNYAGDLTMPLTNKVLNTIEAVFDDGVIDGECKIFRDTPPIADTAEDKAAVNEDFTNIIIFCRNNPGPITFRKPTKADFLGSKSREHYMLPDPAYEMQFPPSHTMDLVGDWYRHSIIEGQELSQWSGQQAESAIKHWYVMRKVMPDAVWELW
ncbi:hypothetical protein LTR37_002095 [Vermiconidia calcicola]|uniref:Uncharacterized protein n=1 Tax=Vermiconidia calcicola TaxID=1690605 RepID=A0ACC3NTP7_9PEZI|nr:hypothetical protein LTR37_002095 [Vermiconidia calcicola]